MVTIRRRFPVFAVSLAATSPPSSTRIRRLRALARLRVRLSRALLLLPLVLVVVVDVWLRGDRLATLRGKYIASYGAAMLESGLLWGLLLFAASRRRGGFRWIAGAAFPLLAALSIGGQVYFHRQYATYLNLDATLFGASFRESIFSQFRADAAHFLVSVTPPFFAALGLVWLGRRLVRPSRRRAALSFAAIPALVAAFLIPCSYRTVQASTPDVIYFHAVGGLLRELSGERTTAQIRPGLRTPPPLPAVSPASPLGAPPNVLFVLTESVRADVACSVYSPACAATPEVNALLPDRLPLTRMHSNSSTTAIELAVLWSGLTPTSTREELHSAPLLFDYAHAAGFDTAYWTSHHMMFANSRLWVQDLPTDFQCGATDLDPMADLDLGGDDFLLAERASRELDELREPFFAVAHFGNTHVPYWIDPSDAPFTPWKESKDPDDNEAYRNFYKNAVHRQDKAIAKLVRHVQRSPFGQRTVIVFTSDHGEGFREHGQLGHTVSILQEEIHVPAFVDAPNGTLTSEQRAALVAARDRIVFHTDLTPTLLDLMGLGDTPAFAEFRGKMVGTSLLRPPPAEPPSLGITNCSGVWGCALRNWGVMKGGRKLEAREWDRDWHCFDVLADPLEKVDLGPAACADLAADAARLHGGHPGAP